MDKIKALTRDRDSLTSILSKHYNLKAGTYELEETDAFINITIEDSVNKLPLITVYIEEGGVKAYINIYPGIKNSKSYSHAEIMEAIEQEGVKYNLDETVIKEIAALHKERIIINNQLIAQGVDMRLGRDALITVNFAPKDNKPRITDDGRIDYKNLNKIVLARKADVLLTKRPATPGIPGRTVKNEEIQPLAGRDVVLLCGEGVMINPSGTQYIATHDGYVELGENIVAVHEVLYIDKDVDLTTGNIKFSGTVHVHGDVLSGFKVIADKDIIVDGLCNDCEITGNNITIKTGIKGTGKSVIRAEGDVTVGYCEKAKIYAKGDLIINKYAFNSELYSGKSIIAKGEGIIAGGMAKAFQEISVRQLGTQGNSKFTVYMGTKYYVDNAIERIRRQKAELTGTLGDMNEIILKAEKISKKALESPKVVKLLSLKKNFEKTLKEMSIREEELMMGAKADKPKVKISATLFEGVTIMFLNCSVTVREQQENMVYYLNEKYSEVAWVSMKDAKNQVK